MSTSSMPACSMAAVVRVAMHVVGLEAVDLDVRDPQRVEHLVQQRDLTFELVGCRRTAGLVLGVGSQAGRLAADVEGHGDMGRHLVAQDVDQHRGEAVDRIGVLTCGRGEVLLRQCEEGSIGQ
jgi:hypothetical protein